MLALLPGTADFESPQRQFSVLDSAKPMLAETGVAATPGIDFDPIDGRDFLRFCYAGLMAEMHEMSQRIGTRLDR